MSGNTEYIHHKAEINAHRVHIFSAKPENIQFYIIDKEKLHMNTFNKIEPANPAHLIISFI